MENIKEDAKWISGDLNWKREMEKLKEAFIKNEHSFPEDEINAGDILTDAIGYILIIFMFIGIYFFYFKG